MAGKFDSAVFNEARECLRVACGASYDTSFLKNYLQIKKKKKLKKCYMK